MRDKGGHSSRPTPENAIYRLAAALGRLAAYSLPGRAEPGDAGLLRARGAGRRQRPAVAADLRSPRRNPADAAAAERLSADPTWNAQLRTTCVATRLEGGHANNALPQLARAVVNCRILPGDAVADVQAALADAVDDPAVQIGRDWRRPRRPRRPPPSTLLSSRSVERLTEAMWPGVPVVPTMSSGATDSRYFRSAGIPAYGVSGLFHDRDDVRAHGRDERLGVRRSTRGSSSSGASSRRWRSAAPPPSPPGRPGGAGVERPVLNCWAGLRSYPGVRVAGSRHLGGARGTTYP